MILTISTFIVLAAQSAALPLWWDNWKQLQAFSSPFVQEGESAAFGKLTKNGSIIVAGGGRLRVEYEKGALLLCDGTTLTQYDPSTRTAQSHQMDGISEEWPLLRLLTDPASLGQVYSVSSPDGTIVKLYPKKPGLPEVSLHGKGAFLHKAEWKDGTGAKQVLTFTSPKSPADPGKAPFVFNPPTGTKWIR
jgi:outer membrane lipoprotein-sorting protein